MSHLSADKTAVSLRANLTLRQDVLKQPPARIEKSLRIQLLLYELRLGHSSANSWLLWAPWFQCPWLQSSVAHRVLGLNAKTANPVPSLGCLSSSHLDSAPTLQASCRPRVICFHSIVNIRLSFNGLKPFLVSSLLPLWAGSLNPIIYEQIVGLLFQSLNQTIVHNIQCNFHGTRRWLWFFTIILMTEIRCWV